MPIEIRITELETLTEREIQELTDYLKLARMAPVPGSYEAKEEEIQVPLIRPRKKRKNVESAEVPSPPPMIISYDELIAHILEITRTKVVTYEKAMGIVYTFGISNLKELSERPELITPIFKALKEITK